MLISEGDSDGDSNKYVVMLISDDDGDGDVGFN